MVCLCCAVLYVVLYVRVNCFVVRGCIVSRRYINVCNNNGMLSLTSVMSPPPDLCDLSVCTGVKLCSLGVFALGVSLVS